MRERERLDRTKYERHYLHHDLFASLVLFLKRPTSSDPRRRRSQSQLSPGVRRCCKVLQPMPACGGVSLASTCLGVSPFIMSKFDSNIGYKVIMDFHKVRGEFKLSFLILSY